MCALKKNCSVQKDINHFAHFCTVPCLYRPRFAKFRASALLIIGKLSCFFILGKISLWMWQGFYTYRKLLIFIYLLLVQIFFNILEIMIMMAHGKIIEHSLVCIHKMYIVICTHYCALYNLPKYNVSAIL